MRVSSILVVVLVVVLVVSLVSIWFYPSVQDFMEGNTMWNGIRDLSNEFAATNIDSLDDLPEMPEESILITIPYLEYSAEDLFKIGRYIDGGGTFILMDDFGYGNSILKFLNINARFTQGLLLDPLFCYKNQTMPRVTDFAPGLKEKGINIVMLNRATNLSGVERTKALAWSSSMSFLDINQNEKWDEGEPKGPFVIAAEYWLGKGTVGLVSDPSVLINTMVGRDDNHSFIRYLIGQKGERGKILIDRAHLTKSPVDVSKIRLSTAWQTLSSPYVLLGIVALIFAIISRYMFKKEETVA